MESKEIVEIALEAIWQNNYPLGGSIYKKWDDLSFDDKELYRSDAKAAIAAIINQITKGTKQ